MQQGSNKHRDWNKRHRDKRKLQSIDKGRDSTRLQRLSSEQLCFLRNKVHNDTIETPFCHEHAVYPRHVQIGWSNKQGEYDNKEISQYQFFVPAQIVLAYEGFFAENKTDDASHLCDNPSCVRVDHLVWESHAKNEARKRCPVFHVCECCQHKQLVCTHIPACIKK